MHITMTIAVLALARLSPAWAGETSWTNPDGGAWGNPANWSNGVPQSMDAAALPYLDGDGYVITVEGGTQCGSLTIADTGVSAPIELCGGSLTVNGPVAIGGPGQSGLLVLQDHFLQSYLFDIGIGTPEASGQGTLDLRGSSIAFANLAQVGKNGTSMVRLGTSAKVGSAWWVCHPGSTISITVGPMTTLSFVTQNFICDGTLALEASADLVLPTAASTLLFTALPMQGAFDVINPITIDGYAIPTTITANQILLPPFNPIVELDVYFDHWPTVVGFNVNLWLEAIHYDGAEESDCWGSDECPYSFEVIDGNAHFGAGFEKDVLHIDGPGAVSIRVTGEDPVNTVERILAFTPQLATEYAYQRIAVDARGAQPPFGNEWDGAAGPRWSADGRYVTFSHSSGDLGCNPSVANADVFVKDRSTGSVECMSGDTGTPPFLQPDISGDGRFVAFTGGSGLQSQVWLADRWTGTTTLVSASLTGIPGDGQSSWARISRDGSTVVFASTAVDLGPPMPSGITQVYAYDRFSKSISIVSIAADGSPGALPSLYPTVSADGRYVTFETKASNLVPDGGGRSHVLLRDRWRSTLEVMDVNDAGEPANGNAYAALITPSGRFVLFASTTTELGDADSEVGLDAFVRDRELGTTTWVSPSVTAGWTVPHYWGAAISDDGEYVVVGAKAVQGPEGLARYLRVRRTTLDWEWATPNPWHEPGLVLSSFMQLSDDGGQLLFTAFEPGLLPFPTESIANPVVRTFGELVPADLNRDGLVNAGDLALLLGAWGSADTAADLDSDGMVGAADLGLLLAAWST